MQAEFRNLAVALVGVVVACGAMAEEIVDERAFIGCPKLLDANGKPRLTRVPSTTKRK